MAMSASLMTGYALSHGLRSDCPRLETYVTHICSQGRIHTNGFLRFCYQRNLVLFLPVAVSVCYTQAEDSIWLGFLQIKSANQAKRAC